MFPLSPRTVAALLRRSLLAVIAVSCLPSFSFAETLKITSNPPGAVLELDGVRAATTPFE